MFAEFAGELSNASHRGMQQLSHGVTKPRHADVGGNGHSRLAQRLVHSASDLIVAREHRTEGFTARQQRPHRQVTQLAVILMNLAETGLQAGGQHSRAVTFRAARIPGHLQIAEKPDIAVPFRDQIGGEVPGALNAV